MQMLCSNILPNAKIFPCMWHVRKTWAKNAIKKIASVDK
jgi:hypothetical protein